MFKWCPQHPARRHPQFVSCLQDGDHVSYP
jgi:hypothetical protein